MSANQKTSKEVMTLKRYQEGSKQSHYTSYIWKKFSRRKDLDVILIVKFFCTFSCRLFSRQPLRLIGVCDSVVFVTDLIFVITKKNALDIHQQFFCEEKSHNYEISN